MDRINIMIYDLLGISISQSSSARFDEEQDWLDDVDVIIDVACSLFFEMNVC